MGWYHGEILTSLGSVSALRCVAWPQRRCVSIRVASPPNVTVCVATRSLRSRRAFVTVAEQSFRHLPRNLRETSPHPSSSSSTRGLYFTKTQEWFKVDQGIGIVGITQVAQRALGEIVHVRLPREGERFSVMDTIVTLEALKTVGEVKCPVAGEVIEVNPRLELEPALVTHAPLTHGWLVRMAFNKIPLYLKRRCAVSREEIEPVLADIDQIKAFLLQRLGGEVNDDNADVHQELRLDGLLSRERLWVHDAAAQLGLASSSHGRGPGRHVLVKRSVEVDCSADGDEDEDDEQAFVDNAPANRQRRRSTR